MDPEAEYAGEENKYGVTQSDTEPTPAVPDTTPSTDQSRGLFGFGVSAIPGLLESCCYRKFDAPGFWII